MSYLWFYWGIGILAQSTWKLQRFCFQIQWQDILVKENSICLLPMLGQCSNMIKKNQLDILDFAACLVMKHDDVLITFVWASDWCVKWGSTVLDLSKAFSMARTAPSELWSHCGRDALVLLVWLLTSFAGLGREEKMVHSSKWSCCSRRTQRTSERSYIHVYVLTNVLSVSPVAVNWIKPLKNCHASKWFVGVFFFLENACGSVGWISALGVIILHMLCIVFSLTACICPCNCSIVVSNSSSLLACRSLQKFKLSRSACWQIVTAQGWGLSVIKCTVL